MVATSQDFTMYAGETKYLRVTVTNDAGAAKNLTGAAIKWNMRKLGETYIEKVYPTGISIESAVGGIFVVNILPGDTEDLGTGTYGHQAEITDSGSVISTVLSGTVTINDSYFD